MNSVVLKLFIFAILLFLSGFLIAFASRNVYKILFALMIMLNGASMMFNVWQDASNSSAAAAILIASCIIGAGGIFIAFNASKKFRTLDIDEMQYEANGENK